MTLADVQQYSQPVSYGITCYELAQWMSVLYAQDSVRASDDLTLDLGLRYDRQTLTDATSDVAPRVGFGWHPNGDAHTSIRGGYGMYYAQIRSNAVAGSLTGTNLDRTIDLNAPSPFERTAVGQVRTVAAANATRPIVPVNSGVRQVSVLMNLGVADYNGLQTQISYRGHAKMFAALSYTLAKATNTTEPDGNGIAPNEGHLSRLGEIERGPRGRSAAPRGHHVYLSTSLQPDRGHGDTARLVATLQRHDRRGQQRRRREQRSADRQRRGARQVGVPWHTDAGRIPVRRRPD